MLKFGSMEAENRKNATLVKIMIETSALWFTKAVKHFSGFRAMAGIYRDQEMVRIGSTAA